MNLIDKVIQFIGRYDEVVVSYALHILFAFIIFLAGRFIAVFISNQIKRILTVKEVEPTIIKFSTTTIRYIILAFTLVAVLGQLGVQTASIVAILGAAGLAIGLALQGSLSNFAAGVLLILFRPFKVAELVSITGILGTVDAIQIFSTTIITPTGESVTIPNNQILSSNVINYSRLPNRRIDLIVGVDYNADIKLVYEVLKSAVDKTANILTDEAITIRLADLAASSLNFTVYAWTKNDNYGTVKTELLGNIKQALDAHNIGIPYPTMDVNIKH